MYLHYRELKLIQVNNRPNEDNGMILRGDYLDKSLTYTEDGQEIPFIMPTRDEILKQFIFPDWQQGDILVIADQPLKHPKKQGDTLVEMTREEVCESGDLSVLDIGEVYQEGAIIKKEKPQGVKVEWIYPNWIETASDSEIYIYNLKSEYSEYKKIDTPSIIREMELLDSSLVDEYVLMMIELRELISKYNMGISTISDIPTPSEKLVDFKNKIKNIL